MYTYIYMHVIVQCIFALSMSSFHFLIAIIAVLSSRFHTAGSPAWDLGVPVTPEWGEWRWLGVTGSVVIKPHEKGHVYWERIKGNLIDVLIDVYWCSLMQLHQKSLEVLLVRSVRSVCVGCMEPVLAQKSWTWNVGCGWGTGSLSKPSVDASASCQLGLHCSW